MVANVMGIKSPTAEAEVGFSLHWVSGLPRTGCNLRPIWHRTLDLKRSFTSNKSVGRVITLETNQWCRICVSGNDNQALLITSKLAIQFCHYRLPLCLVQLPAVSGVNIFAKSNQFLFPMTLV